MFNTKILISAFIVITVSVIVILSWTDIMEPSSNAIEAAESRNALPVTNIASANNIAQKWTFTTEGNKTINQQKTDTLPFTEASVYEALQAVKLDSNGKLILDHDALVALDEALERIHIKLTPESLSALKAMIKKALPGVTGEETAELVENYYYFLGAKDEFSQQQESMVAPSMDNAENISDNQQLYDELKSLRTLHLGNDAAQDLFRISDASAAFMFDSMKLSLDTTLSREELAERQLALQDKQIKDALNIDDWDARYTSFKSSKNALLNAQLSENETQTQIEQLLSAQFTQGEIEKMKYFGLDGAY